MNFQTGLVSISFRKYTIDEILTACRAANLSLVEWGSDVHVPAGDAKAADLVAKKTADAGMRCITYGSYFRIAHTPLAEFDAYLDSACRLGAKNIRLWCGTVGSAQATPEMREKIVTEGRAAAEMAAKCGLTITLECHSGTLTDDCDSAMRYIREVDHPKVKVIYDIYHQQVMEGNIIPSITKNLDCIAHLHAAGHPGRNEMQYGESDYKNIIKAVDAAGYTGALGLEYRPLLDPIESLKSVLEIYG
jgi:hydroxypyruvate isomerase